MAIQPNTTVYKPKYEYGVWRDAWEFAAYAVAILSILSHNSNVAQIAALAKIPYAGLGLPEKVFMIVSGMLLVLGQIDLFKHEYIKISVENDLLVLFRFPYRRTTFRYADLSLRGFVLAYNGKTMLDINRFQREGDLSTQLFALVAREEEPVSDKGPQPTKWHAWKRWAVVILLAVAVIALIYGLIKLPEWLSREPFFWLFDGLLGVFALYRLWKLFRKD